MRLKCWKGAAGPLIALRDGRGRGGLGWKAVGARGVMCECRRNRAFYMELHEWACLTAGMCSATPPHPPPPTGWGCLFFYRPSCIRLATGGWKQQSAWWRGLQSQFFISFRFLLIYLAVCLSLGVDWNPTAAPADEPESYWAQQQAGWIRRCLSAGWTRPEKGRAGRYAARGETKKTKNTGLRGGWGEHWDTSKQGKVFGGGVLRRSRGSDITLLVPSPSSTRSSLFWRRSGLFLSGLRGAAGPSVSCGGKKNRVK